MGIVTAVGVATSVGMKHTEHGRKIEQAMIEAVRKAQAEGITDDVEMRRRIIEARDRVVNEE